VYPSRQLGAQMRTTVESVNGDGSSAWAGSTLLEFRSKQARKLAEAYAVTGRYTSGSTTSS
jgi:hypothetical protein